MADFDLDFDKSIYVCLFLSFSFSLFHLDIKLHACWIFHDK